MSCLVLLAHFQYCLRGLLLCVDSFAVSGLGDPGVLFGSVLHGLVLRDKAGMLLLQSSMGLLVVSAFDLTNW